MGKRVFVNVIKDVNMGTGCEVYGTPGIIFVLEVYSKTETWGSLGNSVVWRLPLAQGAILESRDQVPRQAPCMEPASPSACVSTSFSPPPQK